MDVWKHVMCLGMHACSCVSGMHVRVGVCSVMGLGGC